MEVWDVLTFLHGVLEVLHVPQGFVRRPFAVQLGDFGLQLLVNFGFSRKTEPQTAQQRRGRVLSGQDDVQHFIADTDGVDLFVAGERVDENVSLSGVYAFAFEVRRVLVLHRLLHPAIDGSVRILESFFGPGVRHQPVERVEHFSPGAVFQTRVDAVIEHRSLLVATEVIRSMFQDEVGAGVHTQLVEKDLQIDGGTVLRDARDELLHIRLELIECGDQ
jgi:hypothetical protein